jgi:hypothetical protein
MQHVTSRPNPFEDLVSPFRWTDLLAVFFILGSPDCIPPIHKHHPYISYNEHSDLVQGCAFCDLTDTSVNLASSIKKTYFEFLRYAQEFPLLLKLQDLQSAAYIQNGGELLYKNICIE